MKKKIKSKEKKTTFIKNWLVRSKNSFKVAKPRTTSQIIRMFFKDYDIKNSIIQLDDNHFSVCFEYQDISFSKAN